LLLKTTSEQVVGPQHIPVLHSVLPNVAVPNNHVVSGIQHVPVNPAVSQYPVTVLTSPTFPVPVGPYVCLPPSSNFPMHQDVVTQSGSSQTLTCQVMMPEHHGSHDSGRLIQGRQIYEEERVQEMRLCEPLHEQPARDRAAGRWSPNILDDISYRDRILDDDILRERLEKRLMKEKVEQWKIRDGMDSDRVEFERLRTPHRNIIEAGMFSALYMYL